MTQFLIILSRMLAQILMHVFTVHAFFHDKSHAADPIPPQYTFCSHHYVNGRRCNSDTLSGASPG